MSSLRLALKLSMEVNSSGALLNPATVPTPLPASQTALIATTEEGDESSRKQKRKRSLSIDDSVTFLEVSKKVLSASSDGGSDADHQVNEKQQIQLNFSGSESSLSERMQEIPIRRKSIDKTINRKANPHSEEKGVETKKTNEEFQSPKNLRNETARDVNDDVEEEGLAASSSATSNDVAAAKVKTKSRRRSGFLGGLLLDELPTHPDSIEEGDGLLTSRSSRAAAVVAKTKLAIKPLRTPSNRHDETGGSNLPSSGLGGGGEATATARRVVDPSRKGLGRWPKTQTVSQGSSGGAMASPEAAAAPWVACDKCEKWRKLPKFVDVAKLPSKWFCTMNIWDIRRNFCSAPEETEDDLNSNSASRRASTGASEAVGSKDHAALGSSVKLASEFVMSALQQQPLPPQPASGSLPSTSATGATNSTRAVSSTIASASAALIGNVRKTPRGASHGGAAVQPSAGSDSDSDAESTHAQNTTSKAKQSRQRRNAGEATGTVSQPATGVEKVNWVQCNACSKWRKVPSHVDVDELPDIWYCDQNTWNVSYARCSAKQEQDTTASSNSSNNNTSVNHRGRPSHQQQQQQQQQSQPPSSQQFQSSTGVLSMPPAKKLTQWVQCERDSCKKWRKVPAHVDIKRLPPKWYCEMNTWDGDRAVCQAPEESDNENDGDEDGNGVRGPLMIGNTKGPGALSYRRIIFGTDCRIRPIYSDKNKTGYSLFSYPESVPTLVSGSAGGLGALQAVEDNVKKVGYWASSHYDESGIHFVSALRRNNSKNTKTDGGNNNEAGDTEAAASFVAQNTLGESSAVNSFDSILHHMLDGVDDLKKLPFKKTWPKKLYHQSAAYNSATAFEKQLMLCSTIKSTLLSNEHKLLPLTKLYDNIKSNVYSTPGFSDIAALVSIEGLKDAIQMMEASREILVSTDVNGIFSVRLLPTTRVPAIAGEFLPPKLRNKKSLVSF